jgi:hypothetical protein
MKPRQPGSLQACFLNSIRQMLTYYFKTGHYCFQATPCNLHFILQPSPCSFAINHSRKTNLHNSFHTTVEAMIPTVLCDTRARYKVCCRIRNRDTISEGLALRYFEIHFLLLIVGRYMQVQYPAWTVRGSNPGGGKIFRSRPDRPWGPPSLLYNGYWVYFPGVKRPGRGVDRPPPSSAEVKERVELYLYSPSGSSWPVTG